jgi:hypothetical protein
MSKYAVNQALRGIVTADDLSSYWADPGGFLTGFNLSEHERAALLAEDVAQLYAMGAHHYTLFQWARRLRHGTMAELEAHYFAAIEGLGHPDITT